MKIRGYWKILFVTCIVLVLAVSVSIAFAQDNIKIIVDGKPVTSDVQATIIGDRTMVPARFVAEALGAKVEWDNVSRIVIITTVKQPQLPPPPPPQPQQQPYKFMKFNGEQTSWLYWEYEGKTYVEVHSMAEIIKIKHPTRRVSLFYSSDTLMIDSRNIDLSVKMFDNFKAVKLDTLPTKNILEYEWDITTGNLKLK